VLIICGIDPNKVLVEDKMLLDEKGFFVEGVEDACFISYKYGSA